MYIGKNVNYLRRKVGLTQTDLAAEINKTPGTIGDYEKGRSLPPIDIIIKFTEIFNVSIDDFVNKDLSVETATAKVSEGSKSMYNAEQQSLIVKLLSDKIIEVAKAIKEENPKLYEELGLDGIAEVVKG